LIFSLLIFPFFNFNTSPGWLVRREGHASRWGRELSDDRILGSGELKTGSRHKEVSKIRTRIEIGLVKTQGIALAEVARQLGVSTSAISKIRKRASNCNKSTWSTKASITR